MDTTAAAAGASPAVPPVVLSAAEDTLAATECVGDHLAELLAAAAEDPDAIAELPPLQRARAFLAVAHAATSLFSGRALAPPCFAIYNIYIQSAFLLIKGAFSRFCNAAEMFGD
jgi:hypothetical protein